MKVLLTGGKGFLGKYVQKELRSHSIEFVNYDHSWDGTLTAHYNLKNFGLYHGNFTHLVHLAAKVGGIGANKASPYDFIFENLKMGLNVVEFARENKLEKVVMTGTVCGYPSETPIPFKEEDLWSGYPESTNAPYGVSKRTLTEVLWAANKQHGLNSTVLNLANLYGRGDSQNIETNHVIPAMVQKFKEAKVSGEYTVLWGDGSPTRDFLHVKDAARAIVGALKTPQGPQFGINVGTGVETSIKRLSEMIAGNLSFPLERITWDDSKPNGQSRRCLDCSLANSLLNWYPTVGLEEGIAELCNSEN